MIGLLKVSCCLPWNVDNFFLFSFFWQVIDVSPQLLMIDKLSSFSFLWYAFDALPSFSSCDGFFDIREIHQNTSSEAERGRCIKYINTMLFVLSLKSRGVAKEVSRGGSNKNLSGRLPQGRNAPQSCVFSQFMCKYNAF